MSINLLEDYLESEVKISMQEDARRLKSEYKNKNAEMILKVGEKNISIDGILKNLYYPGEILISDVSEEDFRFFLRNPNISSLKYFNYNYTQILEGVALFREFKCCNGSLAHNVIMSNFLSEKHSIESISLDGKLIYTKF